MNKALLHKRFDHSRERPTAMCVRVLQCVADCCGVLQCIAVCFRVFRCVVLSIHVDVLLVS